MPREKFLSLAALLLGAAVSCQGTVTGEYTSGGPGKTPPKPGMNNMGTGGMSGPQGNGGDMIIPPIGTGGTSAVPADRNAAGPMPLRRLNIREYNNTVRDLLGDTSNPANGFPTDYSFEFLFHRGQLVTTEDLASIKEAAETVAAPVEAKAATLAPCAAGAAEDGCARAFITSFGLRAYRRPLVPEEVERLMGLYNAGRTTLMLTYAGGIRLIVEGLLQSPAFIYHWELGYEAPAVEGDVIRLRPYEVASRLSYFVWGSMPDANLFMAASKNQLGTEAELQAQARRMLADPKARETVTTFVDEWLNLDQITKRPKDPMFYPEATDALKAAMAAETKSFITSVVFDGDGSFKSLLNATNSFVDRPLATFYGVAPPAAGAGMKPVTLNTAERSGLLTRAGFLMVNASTDASSPTKRGRRIYERFLCGVLPPPPKDVPPAKPPTETGTTREHTEEHDRNPCTGACHRIMDPTGYAFEHYDGIGKFRTTEKGANVDSSGSIEIDGIERPFKDARELSQMLADSSSVSRCFATQWLRYAFQRTDTEADQASIDDVVAAFEKKSSVADLVVGVVGSRSFRYRSPGEGEKLQ